MRMPVTQARPLAQPGEGVREVIRVHRRPDLAGEDQPVVLPQGTARHLRLSLPDPVLPEPGAAGSALGGPPAAPQASPQSSQVNTADMSTRTGQRAAVFFASVIRGAAAARCRLPRCRAIGSADSEARAGTRPDGRRWPCATVERSCRSRRQNALLDAEVTARPGPGAAVLSSEHDRPRCRPGPCCSRDRSQRLAVATRKARR
jgi:hypothetical protein